MSKQPTAHSVDEVDLDGAIHLITKNIAELGVESLEIDRTDGYLLGDDVTARIHTPPVDISEKDGFAVRVSDVRNASATEPVTLAVMGQAVAGGGDPQTMEPGVAMEINTGAALPNGADAVVASELCRLMVRDRIEIAAQIAPGQDVLCRGAESRVGQVMARQGARLDPEMIGTLAAVGVERVEVKRRPQVVLLAIGDELASPGTPLAGLQRYASNAVMMRAFLARFGVDCRIELRGDDAVQIGEAIQRAVRDYDLVTTIGGTGYSNRDFVVPVLESLGWTKLFRGVRMAPGKGSLLGTLRGIPVLGLPGGAPSSAMGFYQLMLPLVARLAGDPNMVLPRVEAKLDQAVERGNTDLDLFLKGTLEEEDGERIVRTQELGKPFSGEKQKVLVRIPAGIERLQPGAPIEAQLL